MIVVTGATGNIGRPLVAELTQAGAEVRAVSRKESGLDLTRPADLHAALAGADTLFLLVPAELLGGAPAPAELIGVLPAAGVRRVVLVSSIGAGTRPESPGHAVLRRYEEALRVAGPEWTVLRPGGFDSNAFAWAESVRARRAVAAPFGDVGLPWIDPADIAAVAAVALLADGHAGRTYDLTGPATTTARDRAAAIGAAIGEPVRFIEQSRAEARNDMLHVMPAAVVDATLDLLGTPTADEQRVSPDVERVLGRAPATFADWAARNADAFR